MTNLMIKQHHVRTWNVVSIAVVFCASFNRCAILRRMRVIFTLVSVLPPNTPTGAELAVFTGAAAAAAALGAAAAGLGAFAGAVLRSEERRVGKECSS